MFFAAQHARQVIMPLRFRFAESFRNFCLVYTGNKKVGSFGKNVCYHQEGKVKAFRLAHRFQCGQQFRRFIQPLLAAHNVNLRYACFNVTEVKFLQVGAYQFVRG